jgi:hypothetical protein
MFCPNCRYEYKLGITTCPDCGADLVYKLAPKSAQSPNIADNEKSLVLVYISADGPSITIANSLLDDAGIEYLISKDWRGVGRVDFRVHPDKADVARELLAGLG